MPAFDLGDRYRIGLEMERLEIVRDNGTEVATALLQQSYIDQAQIVFTTLSGTAGCDIFLADEVWSANLFDHIVAYSG